MDALLALAITLLLAAIPFCLSLSKGRPDLLGAGVIFAFGYSASYGLKGWLIAHDPIYITYPDRYAGDDYLWPAFFCSWISLIAFYTGLYNRPEGHRRSSKPLLCLGPCERRLARRISILAVILGAASMFWLVVSLDTSPLTHFLSVEAWGRFRDDLMLAWTDPANKAFFYLPIWAGFFCLTVLALSPSRPTKISKSMDFATVALTLLTLILFGGRAYLLSFVIGLLILRHEFTRRISFSLQLGLLASAVLVGGYLGIVQKSHTDVGVAAGSMEFPKNVIYRLSSSYEQFETLADVLASNAPLDLGRSIAEDVLVTYAPRTFWESKPTVFGYIRGQQIIFPDYWEALGGASTYPIGVLGELYFNFWYLGPIAGLWFLGWMMARIWRNAVTYGNTYIPIYCFVTANFLAPHRWFGSVLLSVILVFSFFLAVKIAHLLAPESTVTTHEST